MPDPYNLQRFVDAQAPVYDHVLAELRRGHKTSHWMWFIFPQMQGLGHSPMARRYGITSKAEAEAYLQHPTLGPRLLECTRLVNQIEGCSLYDIFDSPDDMKFCSSMTLFARAAPDNETFRAALDKYCGGEPDPRTLALLE
ncbi:DUF1810 domain-containing protein [Sorangium sp. So ce131]|uniref:DUF1810 domain-containing protein n=1 Tax=Sorangium sp. So ce131 TaxID=3133282 RepID=UPI003F62B41E